MQTITLKDLGPVHRLEIPVTPGVVVLRGPNDCGKTESLNAVSRALGGAAEVTARDGVSRGELDARDALGIRLGVVKSPRRSGTLEALSIEGKLSIADLVDPGIADPEAADRARIKALLRLSGAQADLRAFYRLFPKGEEDVAKVARPVTLQTADLVELAGRLKADCEAAARRDEDRARNAAAQAEARRLDAAQVDASAPSDPRVLQAAVQAAVIRQSQLRQQRESHAKAARMAEDARRQLEEAESRYQGLSYEQASQAADRAARELDRARGVVAEIKRKLAEAEQEARECEQRLQNALDTRSAALAHENLLASWKEAIDDLARWPDVADEELAEAERAVAEAHAAEERGALIREALKKREEAARYEAEAEAHRKAAEAWRAAAHGVDEVLSEAVASENLFVREGRLMTLHPERGEVPYGKRSHGTRWKLAILEAVRRIRAEDAERTALIPVPQEAWEGLDPNNQRMIHEFCVSLGVTLITAEATAGELRAEVFQEG